MARRRPVVNALHVLVPTALLVMLATSVRAQASGRIEGTVTDVRTHQPLSAASVFIQGTGLGTQTNERGRYVLVNVPPGRYDVSVRRIGYTNVQKPATVSDQVVALDFGLDQAAISLDEVVVTGTALATRAREVPTSTDIVNMEQIRNAPMQNAQQVIAGRIPSVTIEANSGQPGAGGSIKIRGTNTITQGVEPLIYVDGVRIFNELTRNNWGARSSSNALQDINPDDIERIEVVKGAAATTLYGTEASGGVIQIFTKKGLAGRPEWNVNVTGGVNSNSQWGDKSDPTHLFTQCNEYANMYGIATSKTTVGSKTYLRGDRVPFRDPTCPSDGNWTQSGPISQNDLSVRGGNQKVTYFVSGNYNNVQGILPTQLSKDGGFRGNFSFFPIEQLQISLNSAYTKRNTRWAGDGDNSEGFPLNTARGWRGYLFGGKGTQCDPVPDGTYCITNGNVFDQTLSTKSDHYLSGFTLNYTPFERFSNRFAVGWDYTAFNNVTNLPFGFQDFPQGYFWDENSNHTKLSLDYSGSLQSSLWRFNALASTFSWGGQLFRDRHRWTELDVQGFAGPGDPTYETGAEVTYRRDRPSATTNAGFFLQEQLAWRDRLFVTGGLRVDGNSAFGENFGLQKYPKLGVSYVLSDHSFWPKQWVETFKLRGAIGESGKAPGAFDKLRTWSPVTGDENQPGFTPENVGNPNLGPETTREVEGGFDASFLGGLLGAELTYFNARTSDALVPVTRPPSGGFSNPQLQNVGLVRNSGTELQLNLAVLRSRSLDWRVRGNLSRMWSKAIDLGENTQVSTGNDSYVRCTPNPTAQIGQPACDLSKGEPFPQYYGTKLLNPNAIGAPVTASDEPLGLVNPSRLWGIGTTFTFFNNFTVDAFVDHQGGFVVQNYTAYQNARRGVWQPCYAPQEQMYKNGSTAGLTALEQGRCSFDDYDIGYWTEPGDFTKLRYVSLTYNLPQRLVRGADRASISIAGRNLYMWSKYHGSDPELGDAADQGNLVGFAQAFGRDDYYMIPQPRTFTITLRAAF